MRADQQELRKEIGALNEQLSKEIVTLQKEMSQIKSILQEQASTEAKRTKSGEKKPKKVAGEKKPKKDASEKKAKKEGKDVAKEGAKKRGRPPKVKVETLEPDSETDQSAGSKVHADSALRVRDRFYYATFQAPPGAMGNDPEQVKQLLVSNFNRLCGRDSYHIVSAGCAFEEETLTLHCILRGGISLPTTSGALGNCNRTSIVKEKGKAVEYYSEGIKLTPLNRGKGGYITNQILDSVLNFISSFEDLQGCGGKAFDQVDLADGVPDESEIEAIHRNSFDAVTRQMTN